MVLGLAVAALGLPAVARADDAAIRSEMAVLAGELAARPDDGDALLRYAMLSIRLREYEPAISALERLLAFRPDLTAARIELGAGYFALGADAVARRHLLRAAAELPPGAPDTARVTAYLAEIDRRGGPDRLSGSIEAGLAFASNPGLDGASDLFFGFPVAAPDGDTAALGGLVSARLEHRRDLGGADDDVWLTELSGTLWAYAEEADRVAAASFRSGPLLSLTGEGWGPKVRPFVLLELAGEADRWAWTGYGLGAGFYQSLTPDWSVDLTAYGVMRDFASGFPGEDGLRGRALAQVSWTPTRDEALRLALFWAGDDTTADFNASTRIGARLTGETAFDPGLPGLARPAELAVWAEVSQRRFDGINTIVSPLLREDESFLAGASLTLSFEGDWFLRALVEAERRLSTHADAEAENLRAELTLGLRF